MECDARVRAPAVNLGVNYYLSDEYMDLRSPAQCGTHLLMTDFVMTRSRQGSAGRRKTGRREGRNRLTGERARSAAREAGWLWR
jgi:hypothetical protein